VNAADAIGEKGGEISVSANRRDVDGRQEVEIIVGDSGCGIAPEAVSKVFEPFYTTKEQDGTGLGLSVVWGIIDKHDGTIDIRSDLDHGTTVTIRMPVFAKALLVKEKTA
jgi:signal transduction histidine kinase